MKVSQKFTASISLILGHVTKCPGSHNYQVFGLGLFHQMLQSVSFFHFLTSCIALSIEIYNNYSYHLDFDKVENIAIGLTRDQLTMFRSSMCNNFCPNREGAQLSFEFRPYIIDLNVYRDQDESSSP